MGRLIKVAEKKDVPDGEGISVTAEGEKIALFHETGEFFAVGDMCPHAGGPLSEGWLDQGEITCPWHGWTFPLRKQDAERDDGLPRYHVIIEGEDILIELPE